MPPCHEPEALGPAWLRSALGRDIHAVPYALVNDVAIADSSHRAGEARQSTSGSGNYE